MARANVTEVFEAWLRGLHCTGSKNSSGSKTMWTDGTTIYSYNLPILTRTEGRLWIAKGSAPTKTTAQHMGGVGSLLAMEHLDNVFAIQGVPCEVVKKLANATDEEREILIIEHFDTPVAKVPEVKTRKRRKAKQVEAVAA